MHYMYGMSVLLLLDTGIITCLLIAFCVITKHIGTNTKTSNNANGKNAIRYNLLKERWIL